MRFGLVGHPVGHSLSPVMHNAVFRSHNLNCTYDKFDVSPSDLESFIKKTKNEFNGINVTIPHKVAVLKFLDELSEEANLIGAVNTIKFENGRAKGFNTDGIGCVRALEGVIGTLKNRKIFIIGAGGAARAIGFQCVLEGAEIMITNRSVDANLAVSLSGDIERRLGRKVKVIDFSEEGISRELEKTDILIHTTPIGMYPRTDEVIISPEILPPDLVVMDIVYNPFETKFLSGAKKRGCKTIDGVSMLVHQGAESLKIWLGIDADIKLMREAVISALGKHP